MNVSGNWTGEYLFEESASDKAAHAVAGHVVQFEMTMHQGWLGLLSGTVKDDVRTGFPEEGKIKGRLKGDWIEFRRLMPVTRMLHETGRVTLERWAERRKVVIDTDRPMPPILFQGQLSADGQSVEGAWKLEGYTLEVPGSYLSEQVPSVGGTWKARRKA
jgi:hypothetical protein